MKYEVHVAHESGWWMITIPPLDGVTQARRREDVEREAQDYIVVTEDLPPSQVDVVVTSVVVGNVEYADRLKAERETRAQSEALAQAARNEQSAVATRLNEAGVSMRDIAAMLDISHQRVQQLIAARRASSAA